MIFNDDFKTPTFRFVFARHQFIPTLSGLTDGYTAVQTGWL